MKGLRTPFSAWEVDLAFRYLRAKRKEGGVALISVIAFVGITLAVAVLIIVMSVMNGFRTELLDRILGFHGHAFVTGAVLNSPDRDAVVERLRAVPGVVQVSPLTESQAIVIGTDGRVTGAMVRGITPRTLAETRMVSDRVMPREALQTFGAGEFGGEEVLVGSELAGSMFLRPGSPVTLISPTGGATAFGAQPLRKVYTVGGTFNVGMSQYDQVYVFMPLEQSQLFFGKEDQWDAVEIRVREPARIKDYMPALQAAAGPGTLMLDWQQTNDAFFGALQVERTVMRLILMLIVLIAALNIISGLVMLVKNKGRDIAILRTMGAGRGSILRVFFLSGASVGAAGTLTGLLLGVLFCLFIGDIQRVVETLTGTTVFNPQVYFLTQIPARVEWAEVAIVTGWALLASCLATLPPALRASRLDPVEALRYE